MNQSPVMNNLPHHKLPTDEPLILASGSPRRAELLKAAGYQFEIHPAPGSVECGIDAKETASEMVARLAFQKAAYVVRRYQRGLILAADTLAACQGQILGKPANRKDAESMLKLLSGTEHDVYTGVCLWSSATNRCYVDVVRSRLVMEALTQSQLDDYLDTNLWEGKAGAFGYQDGNDWITVVEQDSKSNIVGLPMERLAELLEKFDSLADKVQKEVR